MGVCVYVWYYLVSGAQKMQEEHHNYVDNQIHFDFDPLAAHLLEAEYWIDHTLEEICHCDNHSPDRQRNESNQIFEHE